MRELLSYVEERNPVTHFVAVKDKCPDELEGFVLCKCRKANAMINAKTFVREIAGFHLAPTIHQHDNPLVLSNTKVESSSKQ